MLRVIEAPNHRFDHIVKSRESTRPLAVLLDEAMGSVPHTARGIRLTTEMTVRYRRPTPIDTELVCRAHVEDASERRFSVVATITTADDPDVVLVVGEATFVLVRAGATEL